MQFNRLLLGQSENDALALARLNEVVIIFGSTPIPRLIPYLLRVALQKPVLEAVLMTSLISYGYKT